jgi:hypothetical protein
MSEAECQMADWRAVGFEDGSRGVAASSFGTHRKVCADHGVAAGFDDYLAGHAQGLESFCRPQNGARLGGNGYRYTGVCPEHLEGAFLDAHAESFGLYERQAVINGIDRQLIASQERISRIDYLLVKRTARLLAPNVLPAERAGLVVQIKQLGEEKMALKESIHHLEHEREEAQEDFDSYRSQVAFRELD